MDRWPWDHYCCRFPYLFLELWLLCDSVALIGLWEVFTLFYLLNYAFNGAMNLLPEGGVLRLFKLQPELGELDVLRVEKPLVLAEEEFLHLVREPWLELLILDVDCLLEDVRQYLAQTQFVLVLVHSLFQPLPLDALILVLRRPGSKVTSFFAYCFHIPLVHRVKLVLLIPSPSCLSCRGCWGPSIWTLVLLIFRCWL